MACRYAGVVGAVDGTHIQIIAPSKDEDVFVNRNESTYINTQIFFDATFNILDVVAKWPAGSTRDQCCQIGRFSAQLGYFCLRQAGKKHIGLFSKAATLAAKQRGEKEGEGGREEKKRGRERHSVHCFVCFKLFSK
ncbi:hypothetical protein N1851_034091 [Merluccius polli]|uniref:DDE Tnp4 domain-containing protein n=1 Tax=Merluccius polli TaxID=89951 RepID=A0AA47NMZ4_MERPO|nr:hypothetical protein N1851_034091 [Merluccius polli]